MKRKSATFCNHYRAMVEHDACEAGISYDTFKGMPFDKRPCFRKDRYEAVRPGCDLVEFPTDAEIDETEAWMKERFVKIALARAAIVEACGGAWKRGMPGLTGVIDCPGCSQHMTLHYSRAGYNGHIHAKCDTPNCVSWME